LVPNPCEYEPSVIGSSEDFQILSGTEKEEPFGLMAIRTRGTTSRASAAASTAAASEPETYSMTSMSDAEFDPIPDASSSVPGIDTVFMTGQHSGMSYGRVLKMSPDYVGWGRGVKKPSK